MELKSEYKKVQPFDPKENTKKRRAFPFSKIVLYFVLSVGAFASIFPFYWMFVMASSPNEVFYQVPPAIIPGDHMLINFEKVLDRIPFFKNVWNSIVVSTSITIGQLFLCSLAGFAFAKIKFPGRNVLFVFILLTLMIPPQLGLIPSYIIVAKWFGWLNELKAVIVPGLVGAFGIFWMRQYISEAVPDELMEAAKLDGCRNFRIYWNIVVPIILPAFATLGIFVFMGVWNDFLWPLVVLRNMDVQTVMVAIRSLDTLNVKDYGMIVSGAFWATAPLIIIFLLFNRLFIASLTQGAVKN